MAPSHKAETVNQILTNQKKLFTISRDHFHCGPHATGDQLDKEVAFLSTRRERQNRQEMERIVPCPLPEVDGNMTNTANLIVPKGILGQGTHHQS